ncbi:MAG: hypothetical protein ACE5K3_00985 [bacterium]
MKAQAGDKSITLTWDNPTDEYFDYVRIIRRTDRFARSPTDGFGVYSGYGESFTDYYCVNGQRYYYAAFSRCERYQTWSEPACVSAVAGGEQEQEGPGQDVDTLPPSPPTGFKAEPGDKQILLTWQNPGQADFYRVYLRRKTGSYPSSISDGKLLYKGSGSTFIDKGLTNGTTYYYAIWSQDTSGRKSTSPATAKAVPELVVRSIQTQKIGLKDATFLEGYHPFFKQRNYSGTLYFYATAAVKQVYFNVEWSVIRKRQDYQVCSHSDKVFKKPSPALVPLGCGINLSLTAYAQSSNRIPVHYVLTTTPGNYFETDAEIRVTVLG